MKKIVKSITNHMILVSLLAILLGLVLIIYPGFSLTVLGIVVGVYLIVQGIVMIVLDIKARHSEMPFEGLLPGILSLLLGILFASNPAGIAAYIGIVLGIWIIISSAGGIKMATSMRGTEAPWVALLIINILGIILGGIIVFSPILSSVSLTIALGAVLVAHSIINIIDMIIVKKYAKKVENAVQEQENVVEPVSVTEVENAPQAEPVAPAPAEEAANKEEAGE